jgi:hypothetical protein
VDTYTKLAFAKLYDRKTPITAAELLNDRGCPASKRMRARCFECSWIGARNSVATPSAMNMKST